MKRSRRGVQLDLSVVTRLHRRQLILAAHTVEHQADYAGGMDAMKFIIATSC